MYRINIQQATRQQFVPTAKLLRQWATATLSKEISTAEVTLRIVDKTEMSDLNGKYRHKQGPTNVLSFPLSLPANIQLDHHLLGDIVICAEVVNDEAKSQGKIAQAHWAHMVVHGIYHLLGYDHETDDEAKIMENLEINIMLNLGFNNPYQSGE